MRASRYFVRYILHIDVRVTEPEPAPAPPMAIGTKVTYTSPDTVERSGTAAMAEAAGPVQLSAAVATAQRLSAPAPDTTQKPVVKAEADRVGRNDPCPCGSGRKYKQCHGRTTASGA